MTAFTDGAKRTWEIAVNVDSIKRVRSLCNIDLLAVIEDDILERLSLDPIMLCDVLYALCKPEADRRNITDEEFGMGLAGDAIDQAVEALVGGLIAFFPQRRRDLLTLAVSKVKAVEDKALAKAMTQLELVDPEALLEKLTSSSGSAPESSA